MLLLVSKIPFGIESLGKSTCRGRQTTSDFTRYPPAARDHIHVTKAHLPIDIARALSVNPSLIQKAVETFYTRDAIQLRVCSLLTSPFP
jgi:hypothetical protein